MKDGSRNDASTNGDGGSLLSSSLGPPPLAGSDSRSWQLPSGQQLAEFALCSGFVAPQLLARTAEQSVPRPVVAAAEEKEA